jgi:hypothetical protein
MTREQLEHAIRAACDIADDDEVIIVGSQAILGQYPDAPAELTQSDEVDLFPKNKPARAMLVDGAIGEDSGFYREFGFYVHGVGPETATLAPDWESRLVPVRNRNTRLCIGWCLDAHDLAASKLAAGREKDLEFVTALLKHGYVQPDRLRSLVQALPIEGADRRDVTNARLERLVRATRAAP